MKNGLCGIAMLLCLSAVHADKPTMFATEGGAIRGYDPVAYFTQGKPARGLDRYTFEWQGGTFKFASAENRALFAADPERYAPRYGGCCAYAVSKGAAADANWPGVLKQGGARPREGARTGRSARSIVKVTR